MKMMTRLFAALVLALALAGAALPVAAAPFWTEGGAGAPVLVNMPSLAPLVDKVTPAVVTVYTTREVNFLWKPMTVVGAGSGFIITKDGYILTNFHVVKESDKIKVAVGLKEKKVLDARLIGADPDIDLALIKVEANNLPILPLGNSDNLKVGDWVACIGSPFNFTHTFTVGVVSARGRNLGIGNYDDFVQTDASINSGNSGGPMVNLNGEVMGMNTLIISPSGGNVGIGFATPINLIKSVLAQLKETGKVVRSWLGLRVEPLSEEAATKANLSPDSAVRITQIGKGSPADQAGLEVGDIIIKINGEPITDPAHFSGIIASQGVGKQMDITIIRDGKTQTRKPTLAALPSAKDRQGMTFRGELPANNPLGLGVRDTTETEGGRGHGVVVTEIEPGSPGETNEIMVGDIITKINLTDINTIEEFFNVVKVMKPGDTVRIAIKRGNTNINRIFKVQRW